MKVFKTHSDIQHFTSVYTKNLDSKKTKKINHFVKNKIKEGILSPEKLTVNLFIVIQTLKK